MQDTDTTKIIIINVTKRRNKKDNLIFLLILEIPITAYNYYFLIFLNYKIIFMLKKIFLCIMKIQFSFLLANLIYLVVLSDNIPTKI